MNTIKHYSTPAGVIEITIQNKHMIRAIFIDNPVQELSLITQVPKLSLQGTPFQIKVWQAAQAIPAGTTTTYKNLAIAIGHPKAWRAVATALGDNKIVYFVPCHRVIASNGKLAGYAYGLERKKILLESEGAQLTDSTRKD